MDCLGTLVALEIVLGIDNIIFISVLAQIALLDIVFSLSSLNPMRMPRSIRMFHFENHRV